MLISAAGGGALTAATAHMKYLSGGISSALFITGLFSWIIYSGSFILMQIFHLTLATKQPSMTAPALAAKLKESQDYKEFAELVAKITRSQFAAALGNVGMVIPTAICADYLFFWQSGNHLMSKEYALKTIASLDPTHSLTIVYAALTGIILWLSSIGAGWIENWFVYRRLPETISHSSWIGNTFGRKIATKISAWVCKNISGLGGSLTLGFLLAFTPIGGKFFGLPLDVRHVTLSAGALTFAFCSIGEFTWRELAISGISIIIIGIMNFGVSFVAALYTAAKAREVKSNRLQLLQRAVWAKMKKTPMSFLFPESR